MPDGTHGSDAQITNAADLEVRYGEPREYLKTKERPELSDYCRQFLALCPFLVLSTSAAGDGPGDASPRGDPAGFVKSLDARTIAIPDRPGNRRTDTLHNIVENPHVGILFLVPGIAEMMRINGRARIVTNPAVLEPMRERGKLPVSALVVDIDAVYFQCGKAAVRADLWNPDTLVDRSSFATLGEISADWYGLDAEETDKYVAKAMVEDLY